MSAGFGMSIGSVNSVWAATTGDGRPAVRMRRTAVTFDESGDARVGSRIRFAPQITDFADLTQFREPVTLGGRIRSSADLVSAVATCLISSCRPEAAPVLTYPACYTDKQLSSLQYALHRAGAFDVSLMPEPVAAVEWLDNEYGAGTSGSTLVYDLGANNLDVAVVRTQAEWNQRGVVGRALRSRAYGGRPLGTVLARYARVVATDVAAPVSASVPAVDTRRLRIAHIRNSLRAVRLCLKQAHLTITDIDRILLVGGAARPAEVAEVLAELGPPVVVSADPAHTVASGAAVASARFSAVGSHPGRYVRGAAVVGSAAVVSALAMSAATMIGGGPLGTEGPIMEFGPALAGPAGTLREQVGDLSRAPGFGAAFTTLAARAERLLGPAGPSLRDYADAAHDLSRAWTGAGARPGDPAAPCSPGTYSDPARFTNPLPFADSGAAAALAAGAAMRALPGLGLPGNHGGADDTPPGAEPDPGGTDGGSGDETGPGHSGQGPGAPEPGGPHSPGTPDDSGTTPPSDGSGTTPPAGTGAEDDGAGAGTTPGADTSHDSGQSEAGGDSNKATDPPNAGDGADPGGNGTSDEATDAGTGADAGNAGTADNSANPDHTNGSGTSTGPGVDSGQGAANPGDTGAPGTQTGTGGSTDNPAAGGAHSPSGPAASGPASSPGTSNNAGTPHTAPAPHTGPAPRTAPAPGAGTSPGGTHSAPAVPAHPGGIAPGGRISPGGGISPGLGAGTTPGGGFHGGGLGGGFHGGGFGGGFGH